MQGRNEQMSNKWRPNQTEKLQPLPLKSLELEAGNEGDRCTCGSKKSIEPRTKNDEKIRGRKEELDDRVTNAGVQPVHDQSKKQR